MTDEAPASPRGGERPHWCGRTGDGHRCGFEEFHRLPPGPAIAPARTVLSAATSSSSGAPAQGAARLEGCRGRSGGVGVDEGKGVGEGLGQEPGAVDGEAVVAARLVATDDLLHLAPGGNLRAVLGRRTGSAATTARHPGARTGSDPRIAPTRGMAQQAVRHDPRALQSSSSFADLVAGAIALTSLATYDQLLTPHRHKRHGRTRHADHRRGMDQRHRPR